MTRPVDASPEPASVYQAAAYALIATLLGIAMACVLSATLATGARAEAASASEACLPASIRAAVDRVRLACGPVEVLSTLRPHAHVEGSRHVSLHAACDAEDFRPRSYACAYRVLRNWPYGLSTDGARMRHIHISAPGARNEGRFVHQHRRTRFAHLRARR